jgi:hypothetical protein
MGKEGKNNTLVKALGFISLAVVVLFIIFIHVPDALVYSKSGIMRWMPFLLVFGAFPYSFYKALKLYYPKNSFLISGGCLLIVGLLFGLQITRFDQIALERDGQITQGIIVKKWEFKPSNRDPQWLVQAEFEVNGQPYETFSLEDEKNELEKGQEIAVIYSKQNPTINTFVFMYKKELE